jgi:hypothetical protein
MPTIAEPRSWQRCATTNDKLAENQQTKPATDVVVQVGAPLVRPASIATTGVASATTTAINAQAFNSPERPEAWRVEVIAGTLSDTGTLADSNNAENQHGFDYFRPLAAVINKRTQIPTANPSANPNNVNSGSVAQRRSNQFPPMPGKTINKATLAIRATHSAAKPIGDLSFAEGDTAAAANGYR